MPGGKGGALSYLRDTLAVLSAEENSPGDLAGVLPLEEERLGLGALESEDLAVATDVELTLQSKKKRKRVSMSAPRRSYQLLQNCKSPGYPPSLARPPRHHRRIPHSALSWARIRDRAGAHGLGGEERDAVRTFPG